MIVFVFRFAYQYYLIHRASLPLDIVFSLIICLEFSRETWANYLLMLAAGKILMNLELLPTVRTKSFTTGANLI